MEDPYDLNRTLDEITFAVFDVETTGLNPAYGHRVCEVAVLRLRGGEEPASFESLVYPERSVSEGAFRVNHITPEMLAGAPTFDAISDLLLELMEDAVLVGHNAPFDLGFLTAELEIARRPPPEGPVVDTLALARRAYGLPRNSLEALSDALAVD